MTVIILDYVYSEQWLIMAVVFIYSRTTGLTFSCFLFRLGETIKTVFLQMHSFQLQYREASKESLSLHH